MDTLKAKTMKEYYFTVSEANNQHLGTVKASTDEELSNGIKKMCCNEFDVIDVKFIKGIHINDCITGYGETFKIKFFDILRDEWIEIELVIQQTWLY